MDPSACYAEPGFEIDAEKHVEASEIPACDADSALNGDDDEDGVQDFDDGDNEVAIDISRLDVLTPMPKVTAKQSPKSEQVHNQNQHIKDYNHEYYRKYTDTVDSARAWDADDVSGDLHTFAESLPLTVLIEHVLPFCDRNTWNNLIMANRTMYRLGQHGSLMAPPWPQRRLWSGSVPLSAVAASMTPNNVPVLAVGDMNGRLRLWNGRNGHCTEDLEEGHVRAIRALEFSPAGSSWLASAGDDRSILLWEEDTSSPVVRYRWKKTMDGHEDAITSLSFFQSSPSDLYLSSASFDRTVRIWRVSTSRCLQVLNCMGFTISVSVTCRSNSEFTLASAELGTSLRVWNISSLVGSAKIKVSRSSSRDLTSASSSHPEREDENSCSHDESRSTANTRNVITSRVLDDRPRRSRSSRPLAVSRVHCQDIAYTECGEYLVTVSRNSTIRIWQMSDDECVASHYLSTMHPLAHDTSRCIAVSKGRDEVSIATGTSLGRIRVYRWASSKKSVTLSQTLRGHRNAIESLVFTPNGRSLMSASVDKSVRCWSV